MKTSFLEFLNESINIDECKKGDTLYYKNQYMNEPRKVTVDYIEKYANGEINKLHLLNDNGSTIVLLSYEFKYLSKEKHKNDAYQIGKNIENDIYNIIGVSPKQITDLLSFIKNDETEGNINLVFVEEIKDGRTSKFNINSPLKLKGNILTGDADFKIKVNYIEFIGTTEQPSEYNQYINYTYTMNVIKI